MVPFIDKITVDSSSETNTCPRKPSALSSHPTGRDYMILFIISLAGTLAYEALVLT